MVAQLLVSLGQLRDAVSERLRTSQVYTPSISVAQLDRSVATLPATHANLKEWGYNISVRGYAAARALPASASSSAPSASGNVGGRPSKVHSETCIGLVRTVLAKYLKDSERIVVIGRGSKRRMVLAQHLTKRRHRIFCLEKDVHQAMGKETFRLIMHIHFPHVRNPRRKTDVCVLVYIYGSF